MRFRAGGVRFSVGPEPALFPAEREAVARLDGDDAEDAQPPFRIELVPAPPWTSEDPALFPQWEPAVQRWRDGRLLCSHRSFTAEVDPFGAHARLHRREERAYPLEAVVRTAMMARLPLVGGLALPRRGRRRATAGASSSSGPRGPGRRPSPRRRPSRCSPTSSWRWRRVARSTWSGRASGAQGARAPRTERTPLALLVDLAKGPALRLTRLRPSEALGRVLGSAPVPLALPLWSRALAVVADLVERVPVYRMEWTPDEPPWERLLSVLAEATSRT